MALVVADRVQETSTSTGTGSLTLLGAVSGYQSFAIIGNGNTTFYTITDSTGAWEVGIGTYSTAGPTLARTTVVASSNSGAAVSFGSGVKNIFVTYPASNAVYASNNAGTAGYALISNGSGVAPSWQAISSTTATNIAGGASTYIPYQSGVGATTFSSLFTFDGTFVGAPKYSASISISGTANTGAYSYGSLNYSDANIVAAYNSTANNYIQMILQNGNSGSSASADYVVSNNLGTANTYYGNFGINSSGFTGTGAFSLPNATYLSATTGDLVLGTTTSNNVHIVVNGSATDAITVNTANAVAFNNSYGSAGQVLTSAGNGAPPTWASSGGGTSTGKVVALNMIMGF